MAIKVILTISVDLAGDDYSTGEPDVQRIELDASPAQLWQYELQGPSGGTGSVDNYLLVSDQIPPTLLWIDPQVRSGATFILKGATGDVGVALSSTNPSLIPVAQTNGGTFSAIGDGGTFQAAAQNQIVLSSSQTVQTQIGWF